MQVLHLFLKWICSFVAALVSYIELAHVGLGMLRECVWLLDYFILKIQAKVEIC